MAKRKTKGPGAEALPSVIAAKIQGLLQTATVANGDADFHRHLFDEFIRFLGAHSPWKNCLRDLDCWHIAYRWLYSGVDIPKDANGLLKDYLPPEKLMAMHDEMVAELLSYPRKYSVCFELPALIDTEQQGIQLIPGVTLVRAAPGEQFPDALFRATKGLSSAFNGLGYRATLREGNWYLVIEASGFVDRSTNSSAGSSALSRFKQIIQLCEVHGFGFEKRFRGGLLLSTGADVIAIDRSPGLSRHLSIDIPQEMRERMASLTVRQTPITTGGLLALAMEPKLHSISDSLVNGFARYRPLFEAPDANLDAQRLWAGLEWAFDSRVAGNETQAFLQACIGIEAVLGDDDVERGLTEKLADRCAYLLGRSISERREICSSFKEIYKVRSHLVHGRRKRLDPSQRTLLDNVQRLLSQILKAESNAYV